MRISALNFKLLSSLLALFVCCATLVSAEKPPSSEILATLTASLDSDSFAEREKATHALIQAGSGAVEPRQEAIAVSQYIEVKECGACLLS